MQLHSPHAFIFRDTLFAHGWLRLAPFRWEEDVQTLWRVEQLPSGRVVRFGVTAPVPDASVDRLGIEVEGEGLDVGDLESLAARVRWMFCLDEDLSAFHAYGAEVPGLRRAAERRQGRLLRSPTVFEEVIKTLCCVNARWAQSVKMAERLVERY